MMSNGRKVRRIISEVMAHISIVCSGMFITFLVIDIFNPYVDFCSHTLTKWAVLPVWIVSSVWTSVSLIRGIRRARDRRQSSKTHDRPSDEY